MRVVSLVPSWTETLIACGINVVGRTRYCVHPRDAVDSIAVVGGTKDTRWSRVNDLNPDVLLVDKEENRKEVLNKSRAHYHVSHVESIFDMPEEFEKLLNLAVTFDAGDSVLAALTDLKSRWQNVLDRPAQLRPEEMPGVLDWIHSPIVGINKIYYLIWKNPEMCVAKSTFIGSILSHLGYGDQLSDQENKYPTISLESCTSPDSLLLFSSEPYPFHKAEEREWIATLGCPAALVNGESFSWFGIRSLSFLESILRPQ